MSEISNMNYDEDYYWDIPEIPFAGKANFTPMFVYGVQNKGIY